MSWRKVTEDDLVAVLAQSEVDAFRRGAATDPIEPQIKSTVAYVRGVLRSSGVKVSMNPDEETLPESLILPAMDYLRFSVLQRYNQPANESRTKAYENAVTLFREIRQGLYTCEPYEETTTGENDVAGAPIHAVPHPHRLLD